jgi:sugar-specific transcriptional regulator TrmB
LELDASTIETLTSLGLTVNQAKVYLALTNYERAKPGEIAKKTFCGRPEVYRTLNELFEKGLVERVLAVPACFKAIRLDQGIEILLKERETELKKDQNNIREFLYKFKRTKEIQDEIISDFLSVSNPNYIQDRVNQSIDDSIINIDFLMPWERFIRATFSRYNYSLEEAIGRKVKIRFILDKPPQKIEAHTPQQKKLMKAFKIKFIPQIPKAVCGIFDQKESYVLTNPTVDLKEAKFLWTNNQSVTSLLQDYFNRLWADAQLPK